MTEITQQHLEDAALAAGIKLVPCPQGVLRDCTGAPPAANLLAMPEWAPHLDDGDAVRLAVRLKIDTAFGHYITHKVYAARPLPASCVASVTYRTESNKLCAWREAVVLCAAEIGRQMREGGQ